MPVIVHSFLKVVAWTAINLPSYALPLWLTVVYLREEREALMASGDPLWASQDTPPGLAFFGLALMWTTVLIVLNLVLLGILYWRRRRKAVAQAGNLA